MWYAMHGIVCLLSIHITSIQLLQQNKFIHPFLGWFYFNFVFPITIVTGGYLMANSHIVPSKWVFRAYGLSYITTGLDVYNYQTPRKLHTLCIGLYSIMLVHLFMLFVYRNSTTALELIILLLPPFYFHSDPPKLHTDRGYLFHFVGLLGTGFTISHDQYWIFPRTPRLLTRLFIQNLPFLWYLGVKYYRYYGRLRQVNEELYG